MKQLVFGMIMAGTVTLAAQTQSLAAQALEGEMVRENVSVIRTDDVTLHSFYGVSNSHVIETENELRVVDAQMTFPEAEELKAYIDTLGKPLVGVILSHNHPDHWFGAEKFAGTPILASANVAQDLETGGMRFIKIMQSSMGDVIPKEVIKPTAELTLGAQSWDALDVIVEEYPDQEAHHSVMVKIPSAGVAIGQDLFYNNMFLVASERSRNQNWANLLRDFLTDGLDGYDTLLVGHGKNGGHEIIAQDIVYLDTLEEVMAMDLGKEATKAEMIKRFPNMQAETFLDISMRNLFSDH